MDATNKYIYDNIKYGTNTSSEAMEKIASYLEAVVADPEELRHLLGWLKEMRYAYHCEFE